MILNSVLSRPGARFACLKNSNFYLKTPPDLPEYVRVKFIKISQDIVDKYNLTEHGFEGWVYFKI